MTDPLQFFTAELRRRLQSAPLGQAWTDFEPLALALFALQYARVSAYGQVATRQTKTPHNVRRWTKIPAMPTRAFKEFELSSLAPEGRTRVFFSSGTTGQEPSRHFHGRESLALYEASLTAAFEAHLLPEGQGGKPSQAGMRLIVLTPSATDAPRSSLAYMCETVQRRIKFSSSLFAGRVTPDGGWSLDFTSLDKALADGAAQDKPVMLLGTAFSFVELCDRLQAQEMRFQLPAGSRAMETGGYKGRTRSLARTDLHALISERLGISRRAIVSEYGMSELSSQAYDHVVGSDGERIFDFPPWARATIISPETGREVAEGEIGLVQVVDLANTYSIAAVRTEDLARRRGDGFELLGRAAVAEPRGCSLMAQIG